MLTKYMMYFWKDGKLESMPIYADSLGHALRKAEIRCRDMGWKLERVANE